MLEELPNEVSVVYENLPIAREEAEFFFIIIFTQKLSTVKKCFIQVLTKTT